MNSFMCYSVVLVHGVDSVVSTKKKGDSRFLFVLCLNILFVETCYQPLNIDKFKGKRRMRMRCEC